MASSADTHDCPPGEPLPPANPAERPREKSRIRRQAAVAARKAQRWRGANAVATLDHEAVLGRVQADSGWTHRYAFMVLMSAGIAILGLLLSSPAVIIGAMLISPLMGPIIGLGFALATFDWEEVRTSLLALAAGSLLAVVFAAAIVLLSPLEDVTPEILARTRPNLFDLLVAVFSALAGAYATVRGRGETIVGVAIATALMPPLAVVGFGLATGQWAIFGGALALFFTNFIAIALSASAVARFYGFGSDLSPNQSHRQGLALVLVFALLALPLGWSLRQIAWETWATRTARTAIGQEFGSDGRIARLEPSFSGEVMAIHATVETDRFRPDATKRIEDELKAALGRTVALDLSQIAVNQQDDRSDLVRARQTVEREANAVATRRDLGERLTVATGAASDHIMVDPVTRRATALAAGDRSLADWKLTEQRFAERYPDWTIRILPPVRDLPGLRLPSPDAEGDQPIPTELLREIQAQAWAIQRWGAPGAIVSARQVSGEQAARALARAEAIAVQMRKAGLPTTVAPLLPVDRALEREQGSQAARAVQLRPADVDADMAPDNAELTPPTAKG